MAKMIRGSLRLASLSALLLAGCSNAAVPAEKTNEPRLATFGYQDIKLGSSLEDTLKKIDTRFYSPEDVANCLMGMPAKGCILIWNNWAFPYIRKNGIPYNLNTSFNQWNNLTDINLTFSHRDNDISRGQCLEFHGRTLEWVTNEYGPLERKDPGLPDSGDFLLISMKDIQTAEPGKTLNLSVISHFIGGRCQIVVGFADLGKRDRVR